MGAQGRKAMNLTTWVDVAIGLSLVYLGTSLFVTVINEYIAQIQNLRGKQLFESLNTLISDKDIKTFLAQSPALKPFFDGDKKKAPSYVDPNMLAQLLVGGMAAGTDNTFDQVSSAIDKWPNSALKTQLQAVARTTEASTDALVKAVSDWTNRSLTMLGEGYKRNLQTIGFLAGLAVAIGFNIDTVALTKHLYRDKEAREAAVTLGVQITEQTNKGAFEKCMALTPQKRKEDTSCAPLAGLVDAVQGRNETLGKLPIGWPLPATNTQEDTKAGPLDCSVAWLIRFAGWLLTALALSLGAPFWFDLLNKLINMRHGMRKPEVKDDKANK